MFDRVLFPTDGSDVATRALDYAVDVAETYDATLHVVNVADTTVTSTVQFRGEVVDALESEGERIVADDADRARPPARRRHRGGPGRPPTRPSSTTPTHTTWTSWSSPPTGGRDSGGSCSGT